MHRLKATESAPVAHSEVGGQGFEAREDHEQHRNAAAKRYQRQNQGLHFRHDVPGKMLKWLGPDISAVTARCGGKHLQDLKMFAAIFPFACVVVSTRHSVISAN